MEESREKKLLQELDRLALVASIVSIIIFGVVYFVVANAPDIPLVVSEFVLGLILNLIPIFLIFIVSYLLIRRIQTIKSERETEDLASKVVDEFQQRFVQQQGTSSQRESHLKDLLIQSKDSGVVYLVDRFGLPHPIQDKDSVLYFMQILGYNKPDDLPKVDEEKLRPFGANIPAIDDWEPPKSEEEKRVSKITHQARHALELLRKEVRDDGGAKMLSFDILNNSDDNLKITSAELVFDSDAPLAKSDIDFRNKPTVYGLLTCTLLFNGDNESKTLIPHEECTMNLLLKKQLTPDDITTVTSKRLGYINVDGVFRDTQINFHMYV